MSKMTENIQNQGIVYNGREDEYKVSSISHKDATKVLKVIKKEIIKVVMDRPEYDGPNRLHSETLLIARIIDDISRME